MWSSWSNPLPRSGRGVGEGGGAHGVYSNSSLTLDAQDSLSGAHSRPRLKGSYSLCSFVAPADRGTGEGVLSKKGAEGLRKGPSYLLCLIVWSGALLAATTVSASGRSALKALLGDDGVITVLEKGRTVATITVEFAGPGWTALPVRETRKVPAGGSGRTLLLEGGGTVTVSAEASRSEKGVRVRYLLATTATIEVESIHAAMNLAVEDWVGAPFALAGTKGRVPASEGGVVLAAGAGKLALGPAREKGLKLTVAPASPSPLLLQDSRRWYPGLDVRVQADHAGQAPWEWKAGREILLDFTFGFGQPMEFSRDRPVVIKEGRDWYRLSGGPEVEAGSVLDWSGQRLTRSPAGSQGWLVARGPHFEFADTPGTPVRFYGVNIGTGACFPSPAESEVLADRLVRRGYNTVRIHHYESAPWIPDQGMMDPNSRGGISFNEPNMKKFDAFFAALKKRGIYVTTDLYVSRLVPASVAWPGDKGNLAYKFKHLICVSDDAMENWKGFCLSLLTRVNPHTGLAYRDDPALALLCLVNEGNLANDIGDLRSDPREAKLWEDAFAEWKKRNGVEGDWGGPEFHRFLWDIHAETEAKQVKFLREEVGVKALLTDLNGWTDEWGAQVCRTAFDYVDNHMYWDHPNFIEAQWRLPARGSSGGGSAIRAAGTGHGQALSRLLNRPFTVTEFHFVPPNPFRGESGLLWGGYAALQDWGGLWRFSYSGDAVASFRMGSLGWFETINDPLTQAAEYAAVALFLRSDLAPAPHVVAVSGPEPMFRREGATGIPGTLGPLGWCARVGSEVESTAPAPLPADADIVDFAALRDGGVVQRLVAGMFTRGLLGRGNATAPARGIWEAPGGTVKVESREGVLTVKTARTAGVAGPAGTRRKAGPLEAELKGFWAALWASSVDGKPLAESGRIALFHLTDLANSGEKFAGESMKVLQEWGSLPWLVRAGTAAVRLKHARASSLGVWRLDITGKRVARVPARASRGVLSFEVDTATKPEATIFYEVAGK